MKKKLNRRNPWIILTGLSGAGKNSALKVLEDQGYIAIDNLPLESVPSALPVFRKMKKVALGLDSRASGFLDSYPKLFNSLRKFNQPIEVLFLDCQEKTLVRRFSETRRLHPLQKRNITLIKAIRDEKIKLEMLRKQSDQIIDTSRLNIHQLKHALHGYLEKYHSVAPLNLTFLSFGYKYGLPQEADMVFDCRILPNPFFEPRLKWRSGKNLSVIKYLEGFPEFKEYFQKIQNLVSTSIPMVRKEGKAQWIVAFGCTGGRHRSVAMAQLIAAKIKNKNIQTTVIHRDIGLDLKGERK